MPKHHGWRSVIFLGDSKQLAASPGPMKRLSSIICALLAAVLEACSSSSRHNDASSYAPLILISIDGYRADYISRGRSPTLEKLAADGVRAEALRSSFPTLTFPNHYTIVTGLYPDHHGIVNNRFYDPVSGNHFVYKDATTTSDSHWWGGEPIWVDVEKHGKHAATMFWPGSDVEIGGVRPDHWLAFDGEITSDARVDQVLQWLDLPPKERPVFVTLYLDVVDHAGHDFGPDSAQVDSALVTVDNALARLVEGLKRRHLESMANLIIVSDHGMTPAGADKSIAIDDTLPLDSFDLVNGGVLAGIAPKPGHERDVDAALLGPHDHMTCWRKAQVPLRFHYGTNPRIPPYLCLANDGWIIETKETLAKPDRHISLGEHGYDNDDPNMRALFVAHGPAFKQGLLVPEFDNVDIYPMLARILGVPARPNDGDIKTVEEMLAPR